MIFQTLINKLKRKQNPRWRFFIIYFCGSKNGQKATGDMSWNVCGGKASFPQLKTIQETLSKDHNMTNISTTNIIELTHNEFIDYYGYDPLKPDTEEKKDES